MIIPITFLYVGIGLPYYLTWMAFGHVIGVSSSDSSSVTAGIAIHLITAISIGVATGVFLYKTGILNISKLSNGLLYGILAGSIVFVLFFIPVYHFILAPEIARTMNAMHSTTPPTTTFSYGQGSGYETPHQHQGENNFLTVMIVWMIIHLIFAPFLEWFHQPYR